ncbi:MAG: SAM hydroxide adenosyltransferase [Pirellulales bacterium]
MAGTIKGTVVDITDSGDAVTDIENSSLADAPRDESISIACGGHKTVGLSPADHDQPEMTYIAVLGNSGALELSLVGDSAAKFLCLKVGDPVKIVW